MSEDDLKRGEDIGAAPIIKNPELPTPYYQDDYVTLYHADCREVLPLLEPVDLVLTDPPYGIERFAKGFGTTRFKGYGADKKGIEWDKAPNVDFFEMLLSKSVYSIIWGMNYFELPKTEHFLVWYKHQPVDNFADAEIAWTNLKRTKVFDYSIHLHNQRKFGGHPTEKPVELMRWCIKLAGKLNTILDPFVGSGTTLRAAKDMGIRAIGIEREEQYCEVAANRLRQEVLGL